MINKTKIKQQIVIAETSFHYLFTIIYIIYYQHFKIYLQYLIIHLHSFTLENFYFGNHFFQVRTTWIN